MTLIGWIDKANPADVTSIYLMINSHQDSGVLAAKSPSDIYAVIEHFWVIRGWWKRPYDLVNEEKIFGCCSLSMIGKNAELGSVVVLPEYQGTGMGKKMLLAAISKGSNDANFIYCFSRRSSFFEKIGFKIINDFKKSIDNLKSSETQDANGPKNIQKRESNNETPFLKVDLSNTGKEMFSLDGFFEDEITRKRIEEKMSDERTQMGVKLYVSKPGIVYQYF